MKAQTSYSVAQFSIDPDRRELLNIGVIVFDALEQKVHVKFTEDFSRIQKAFGRVDQKFLSTLCGELEVRLIEESRGTQPLEKLTSFQSSRSNNIRLTPFSPLFSDNASEDLERLFLQFVGGASAPSERRRKVKFKLKESLAKLDVLSKFEQRPRPITIPRYKFKIRPDFGLRRERYQVIEAVRFTDKEESLRVAGFHALAGRTLAKGDTTRLVVVGEFDEDDRAFYNAIKDDLESADTKLYRMDQVDQMVGHFGLS